MAAQPPSSERAFFCEHCGEYLPEGAKVCPRCGYPVGGTPAANASGRSGFLSTARTASLLFALSGVDGLIGATVLLTEINLLVSTAMTMGYQYTEAEIRAAFLILIGFVYLASVLTLVAAYFARKRKHFHLVAVCGFFSIFTLGIIIYEGSFLGLLGLITTFRARKDFS